MSGQSSTTVQHIDQMAQHLDGNLLALLEDVKSIADQTNLLALKCGPSKRRVPVKRSWLRVVAGRSAQLSERSTTFNEQIRKLAHSSKDAIAKVRETVSHMASRDMDAPRSPPGSSSDARQRRGRSTPRGRRHARSVRVRPCDRWQRCRSRACLQFEDIATQALGGVHTPGPPDRDQPRSGGLQELLHAMAACSTKRSQRPAGTAIAWRELRSEWERPPHKTVAQQSMGAGTVELF